MPTPSRPRFSKWAVAAFFTVLVALGLFTSPLYGQPWDEVSEQDILRMNLNQYAAALNLPAPYEGQSRLIWPQDGLIENSVEKDHGESAYYPLFWLVGDIGITGAQRMVLWHAYTWLWFMGGVAALWLISRRLGLSRLGSSVAALFLVISPRMFAEGHYNNKDMVLMALVLIAVWLSLRWMEQPASLWRAFLFSLAGALAANTKMIGLLVWGLCALTVLFVQILRRRLTGRVWLAGAVALLGFIICYALLTPALWSDPAAYLRYVLGNTADFSRWKNWVLFRGAVFSTATNPLPFYYLPYMILVTTPLWILALMALGFISALTHLWKHRKALGADQAAIPLLLCIGLWLLPFMYAVLTRPTMYNGWRHMYFIYGPLLVMAAYGLHRAALWLKQRHKPTLTAVAAGALAVCILFTGSRIAVALPNEYTYFNILLGNRDLTTYMELDYWNVSSLQTLRAFLDTLAPGDTVTICAAESRTQQGLESAWELLPAERQRQLTVLSSGNPHAEYVMANTAHAMIWSWQPDAGMTDVAGTDSYGQRLCTVYRVEANISR